MKIIYTRTAEVIATFPIVLIASHLMFSEAVAATPPAVSVSRTPLEVVVRFDGWLQIAAHPDGPYTNVSNLMSPLRASPTSSGQNFWRAWRPGAKTLAVGDYHSVAVKHDGTLWAWGANFVGELGNGTSDPTNLPTRVGTASNWIAVACGSSHTLGLRDDGSLWAWGLNHYGQLGIGTLQNTNTPVAVEGGNWVAMACAGARSTAIKADGTLWAWGLYGAPNGRTNRPVQVGLDKDWRFVDAGGAHAMARKSDGSLWAWGVDRAGCLGLGPTNEAKMPVLVGVRTNWLSVACGESHTIAVRGDGTLWVWGDNDDYELGLGYRGGFTNVPTRLGADEDWISVAAAGEHAFAIKDDGSLWCWGVGLSGALGIGAQWLVPAPIRVGSTNWFLLTAAPYHTLALDGTGRVYSWGTGLYGALGQGELLSTNLPSVLNGATGYNPR